MVTHFACGGFEDSGNLGAGDLKWLGVVAVAMQGGRGSSMLLSQGGEAMGGGQHGANHGMARACVPDLFAFDSILLGGEGQHDKGSLHEVIGWAQAASALKWHDVLAAERVGFC